ncbi:MAG: zinc ABC transporter substrate-binding protein [Bacteroidota bacterium]
MKKTLIVPLIFILLISCSTGSSKENSTKLHVITTTGMLYDAVLNIVGDKMTCEAIMGPGVDPHLYKATQGDLTKLRNGQLIVYNGIFLEGKMSDILKELGKRKPTLAAAESIPDSLLLSSVNHKDSFDPHVWFDVKRWQYVVSAIGNAVVSLDTENAKYYGENMSKYLVKLDSMDKYVRDRLSELSSTQRVLVTAHDAFGYFGDAYEIRVEALQGISTVSDFGLKDIANLIDLIIDNQIKAIFVETSVSEKSINAVIKGCQEKGHDVKIGGSLYSDAMGELGTEEGTYIGMFKKNVDTIVDALK